MQQPTSLPGAGVRLTPWMAPASAAYCSMRCVEGTDPEKVANRVAFIEKTPRVRRGPFTDDFEDYKNWEQAWKGDDGWDPEAQAWCDEQLVAMGYTLPEA